MRVARAFRLPIIAAMTALALSGCIRRSAPVAVAPQPTLDAIAYSGPAPVPVAYAAMLKEHDYGAITTEILDAPEFYYAEDYHQQYLAKNPMGYCGLGGTGVACPIGLVKAAE